MLIDFQPQHIKTVDPSLERYLIVDLKKGTVCRPWSLWFCWVTFLTYKTSMMTSRDFGVIIYFWISFKESHKVSAQTEK